MFKPLIKSSNTASEWRNNFVFTGMHFKCSEKVFKCFCFISLYSFWVDLRHNIVKCEYPNEKSVYQKIKPLNQIIRRKKFTTSL